MIESRFYNVRGVKWEARFFRKGESLPESDAIALKQGIWARPTSRPWDEAVYVGSSWRFVNMDPDVLYMPDA